MKNYIYIIIAFVIVVFCFGIALFIAEIVTENKKEINNTCKENVEINYCPMCR